MNKKRKQRLVLYTMIFGVVAIATTLTTRRNIGDVSDQHNLLDSHQKASVHNNEKATLAYPYNIPKPVTLSPTDKANVLKGVDLTIPGSREKALNKIRELEKIEKENLEYQISTLPTPTETTGYLGQWTEWQLVSIDPVTKRKRVLVTHDIEATIAANAHMLATNYFATGLGVKVGVWDSGAARTNHQEYSPRAASKDGAKLSGHATHVTGIILSKGARASAKAISFEAEADSYDWNNEFSEIVANAAASENDTNKIGVSNHSYGYMVGWVLSGTNYIYYGDWNFGIYGIAAKEADTISHSAPYYLMVRSAGNERNDNPTTGSSIKLDDWSPVESYNPATHPLGDGVRKQGYDTLSEGATAKNILTVGAVNKATTTNQRDLTKALMTSFSSWGPTDDGRIKPDLVASGLGIYTTASNSSTAYNTNFSGTSASAPLVASAIASLTHRYRLLSGKTHIRASTTKALLVSGADDLGPKGPDYQYGHGHINAQKSIQILEEWLASPSNQIVLEAPFTIEDSIASKKHRRNLIHQAQSAIKVVLCWTDPPGEYNFNADDSKSTLVHNLELRLIDSSGNTHLPYVMPYAKTFSTADLNLPAVKAENSVDNTEVIEIDNPTTGKYILEVYSKGTLTQLQNYSVVISGLIQDLTDPEPTPYEVWAESQFGSQWKSQENTQPNKDFDTDGFSNGDEFLLGTNPLNTESKLCANILKVENSTDNKKKVTIRVSPVVNQNIGLTKIISTDNLSKEIWDGPTVVTSSTQNQTTKDIIVEVEGEQFFFKAQFEAAQAISVNPQ